jgi:hypothetical protein
MQNKLFNFTSETKKFSFFSMPLIPKGFRSGSPRGAPLRELLTSNAGSIQGILSKATDCCPYSSRKSLLNCKFTLCKNKNTSYRGILLQLVPLTFQCCTGTVTFPIRDWEGTSVGRAHTLKTKIQVMSRWFLSPGTLISFPKKTCSGWYVAIFSFYIHKKIHSHSMGSNIYSIKAIKKALSQIYSIRKNFGIISKELRNNPHPPFGGIGRNLKTLYRVPNPSNPKGLEGFTGKPAQLKRQSKQDSKQLFSKILLFLKKETLKKSYQTPAVIITKLNQQLHSTPFCIISKFQPPSCPIGQEGISASGTLALRNNPHPPLGDRGVEGTSVSVLMALRKYYLAYPNDSKKEANSSETLTFPIRDWEGTSVGRAHTLTLMNKSIKKLIWTMLKKQYSNISLSLIANRNWFFLLVKNLRKINLFNRLDSGPHPFGGKKSDSFQQMSYFLSLSLVPFKSVSLKIGKSCLVQLNSSVLFWSKKSMVSKKIDPDFVSNCVFDPGFVSQVETREFNLLFKWVLISPIQGSFCMTVKSEARLNTQYLECSLFLKRNLYNNYTFLYTFQQLHKEEKYFPSRNGQQKLTGKTRQQLINVANEGLTNNLQINPLKEIQNGIRKNYLLGITHYLDSSKRQQSVLKRSKLFEQFSFISDKLVISKLYYFEGIFFTYLGTSRHSSKKAIVQNKKQNYPLSPFKNSFLFQVSYKRIKYKKKQKVLYIWKNQDPVTSFCHYSF